jgi:hypothetical protein
MIFFALRLFFFFATLREPCFLSSTVRTQVDCDRGSREGAKKKEGAKALQFSAICG